MFANRISYWLNAKGPSHSIDAACCSSTVALEQAYQAITRGECEAAIVGGANLCLHPQSSVHYGRIMNLSKNGKTKSYDLEASGCAKSEAINVLFLQKAKDALRIYADVVNVQCEFIKILDGETGPHYGFYRDPDDTARFLKRFYDRAGVSPSVVEYVEGFGSAVPEADKSELDAFDKIFCNNRDGPLMVGSVMSNIGYGEAASGISAITKVLLGYHRGELAGNLNCETPRNDVAAIIEGRIQVLNEHQQFRRTYAAVNSLSVTGLNAHVLLHGHYKPKNLNLYKSNIPHLVTISGRQDTSVKRALDELKSRPIDPEQLALLQNIHQTRINGHLGRGYAVLDTKDGKTISLSEQVDYFDDVQRPLWFVYSGMGSQWPGMGKQLMRMPIFSAAIERCRQVLEPNGIDIVQIITSLDKTIFDNILHSFVGIAAVQIGLTDVLRELGLVPDKIIGHSVGELGCAYADGCLSAEEMILSAYSRGLVSKMCPPEIEIACHNSADSCTISGPADAMKTFVSELSAKGIFAKEVPCSNIAYHSSYIAKAVLFEETSNLIPSNAVLVEIAPHGLLQAILKRSLPESCTNIPLTRRGHTDSPRMVLQAVGKLYMEGYYPKVQVLYPKVEFPVSTGTPFLSYLVDWAHSEKWALPLYVSAHRMVAASCKFMVSVHDDEHSYLKGHVIRRKTQLPFSYALVAAWDTLAMTLKVPKKQLNVVFNDVHFHAQPVLHDQQSIKLVVSMHRGSGRFEIMDDNMKVATGFINSDDKPILKSDVQNTEDDFKLNSRDVYRLFYEREYAYRRMVIDVKEHLKYIITKDDTAIVKAHVSVVSDLTRCGGVFIENLKFHDLPASKEKQINLKILRFVPRFQSNIDKFTSLLIFTQIVAENINKDVIKIVGIAPQYEDFALFGEMKRVASVESPGIRIEFTKVITNTITQTSSENIVKEADLLLVQKLANDEQITRMLQRSSCNDVYIINDARNTTMDIKSARAYSIVSVLSDKNNDMCLELIRFRPALPAASITFIVVRSEKDLASLIAARSKLSPQNSLSILSTYPSISGLKSLVKHWRKDSSQNNIKLILFNDTIDTKQLDKLPGDFAFSIMYNVTKVGKDIFSALIHGGAGALGQAMISICLAKGYKVFTTASTFSTFEIYQMYFTPLQLASTGLALMNNDYKVHALEPSDEEDIGNSRDASFADMVLGATGGIGCDIVICCLKGDLKNTYDTFRIPNQEIFSFGMHLLSNDTTYTPVDISSIFLKPKVGEVKRLQTLMSEGIASGAVRPLSRVTYALHEVSRAFNLLAASRHRGRVLLRFQDQHPPAQRRLTCSGDKCHIIFCDEQPLGLQLADMLISSGAKKIHLHFTHPPSYLSYKQREWSKQDVQLSISSDDLHDETCVSNFLQNVITSRSVEGVYLAAVNCLEHTMITTLDMAVRKLCPSLKNFLMFSYGDDFGQFISIRREKDRLPATVVNLSMLETVLTETHFFTYLMYSACKALILNFQYEDEEGVIISKETNSRTTLEDLGIQLEKSRAVSSFLRDVHNISIHEADIPSLSIQSINTFEERITDTKFEDVQGLGTFFSFVDPDELLATTEMVFLPTLTNNSTMRDDEFDLNQTFLCIVPGLEGHHERFRSLCERLKLPALVLQPGLDHLQETIEELALRYSEVVLKRAGIKNSFYLLGFETGVLVALELAAILEQYGQTGTVFCIGDGPEEVKSLIKEQLREYKNEDTLQIGLVQHMFTLMTGESAVSLKNIEGVTWRQRVDICVRTLLGHVPHSAQYARSLIEAAYARIATTFNYNAELIALKSNVVVLRALSPHSASSVPCTLHRYSQQPISIYNLTTPLAHVTRDMRCASIINKHLSKEILEEFEVKNLCETYLSNADTFMTSSKK
ncbi:Uncharacterized protein OBRU01_17234 [Operophtera brumata]|uniref:Ketosynthase family 3 (KS3) domain-containing protein n=1 Tax=Operophtera brumata TaxID=104452 RepID=A0A0L7L1N0_OPEBR|nr:Uncharacterized protein OBRU01_17234 [Operophtera brumata]